MANDKEDETDNGVPEESVSEEETQQSVSDEDGAVDDSNEIEATESVKHLVSLNNERKKLVKNTMAEAEIILSEKEIGNIIVIGKNHWQAGILGLVASKIVEKYKMINPSKTFIFKNSLPNTLLNLDKFHFENAIGNIIDNATKYGGKTITVELASKNNKVSSSDKLNLGPLVYEQTLILNCFMYAFPSSEQTIKFLE